MAGCLAGPTQRYVGRELLRLSSECDYWDSLNGCDEWKACMGGCAGLCKLSQLHKRPLNGTCLLWRPAGAGECGGGGRAARGLASGEHRSEKQLEQAQ